MRQVKEEDGVRNNIVSCRLTNAQTSFINIHFSAVTESFISSSVYRRLSD